MKTFEELVSYQLGTGIYSFPEIAFILRLPKNKVSRYVTAMDHSSLGREFQRRYIAGKGRERVTSFATLIEFYVFYQIRALLISADDILSVHSIFAEELNTPYPFATSILLSDPKRLLLAFAEHITFKPDQRITFEDCIKSFHSNIDFTSAGIADCFYPMGRNSDVVVDPHHRFGEPTIQYTNLSAEIIFDYYIGGETCEFLSHLYNVPLKKIEDAIAFFTSNNAA
jgi:uncharacterized protein (DUF433 family)